MIYFLVVVSVVAFGPAEISTIGPCSVSVKTQHDLDFDKFPTENGGNWKAVLGSANSFNKNLVSFTMKTTPTGKKQFKDVISYSTKDGKSGTLPDEVITYNGNGVCTATTADGDVYTNYVLKYVPGRYIFYYMCSKDGSDVDVDSRYVLAHGPLTPEEHSKITRLDSKFGFKGKLIPIGG